MVTSIEELLALKGAVIPRRNRLTFFCVLSYNRVVIRLLAE